jgi:iron complex outermembrane receptor protein
LTAEGDYKMRAALFSTTFLAGCFAIAAPAFAQDTTSTQPPASTTVEPASDPAVVPDARPAAAAIARGEEIIVTGSRISRRDFKAESAISTISSASIAAAGQPSLDRVIGQMPQFEAAQGAAEVGDVQGGVGFGGGASYSNLRGIGRNRSLVLMDGRRLMPSTPDGSIDLNTIPMSMIDSVEVITGGASAAYGSDAIAGVANFKLRQNFTGIELKGDFGISTHGDGATTQLSGIVGGKFDGGRGHAVLAVDYGHRQAVAGSERSFFTQSTVRFLNRQPEGAIFKGGFGNGSANPSVALLNSILAQYPGTTPVTSVGDIGVNTDGTIFTSRAGANCAQNYRGLGSVPGTVIANGGGVPGCTQAGVILGNYFAVQVPLDKINVFTKADYELGDHLTAYAQFNFSDSKSFDTTGPGSTKQSYSSPNELAIPVSNPFIQGNANLLALVNSAYGGVAPSTAVVKESKIMFGFGSRYETFKYNVWQGVVGVRGDIPGTRLSFDVYGSYGRSNYTSTASGDISLAAINNVLATETLTSGPGGCIYNPFGYQPVSAACLAYAGRTDNTTNEMAAKNVEATIQGPLFALPGGDAKFALGADYRQSHFNYHPDSIFVTGDTLAYGTSTPAKGSQNVKEVFGELLLPFLANQPFAEELSLDLGARYSKYNTFAGKKTWKADLSWEPVKEIRFRGGYSVAIRAPSLADLYNGLSVNNLGISGGDPCNATGTFRTGPNATQVQALCAAQSAPAGAAGFSGTSTPPIQTGGNSLLQPERAKTWTVGAVVSPFSRFHASVDYYNIKIAGAISSLGSGQIIAGCYGSALNPSFSASNPFCQRIQRDPSGGSITLLTSGLFNYNSIKLDGIDAQFDYSLGLGALGMGSNSGTLQFGSVVSYLKHYDVTDAAGNTAHYAGTVTGGFVTSDGESLYSHPKWKANTTVGYSNGSFGAAVHWRYIGRMTELEAPNLPIPAYSYFDVEAHYRINAHFTLGVGVNNIGNKIPPFIGTLDLRTDAATYDVIGRTMHASLKAKF